MAATTVDDLVNHLIEVNIDASTQNSAQTGNLVASDIEKAKREDQHGIEQIWSKRQRELNAAIVSQSELQAKYKEWTSAQDCDLLDRPLPLAAMEALNKVMSDELVRIAEILVAYNKKTVVTASFASTSSMFSVLGQRASRQRRYLQTTFFSAHT